MGREITLKSWIANWLVLLAKKDTSKESTILFLAALWSLWCLRNDLIFRKNELSFTKLINHYRDSVVTAQAGYNRECMRMEYMRKLNSSEPLQDEYEKIRNYLPFEMVGTGNTCQVLRIKVDAAWDANGFSAYGWVCSNDRGESLFEGCAKGRAQSPLQAEAKAIREVLIWARNNRMLHIWITSDCLQAITQLAAITAQHHHCQDIIHDIVAISAYFHCCLFSFIPRALNRRAHILAQRAKRL